MKVGNNPCKECIVKVMCRESCDSLNKFIREFFLDLGFSLNKFDMGFISAQVAERQHKSNGKIIEALTPCIEFGGASVGRFKIKNGQIIEIHKSKNLTRIIWIKEN